MSDSAKTIHRKSLAHSHDSLCNLGISGLVLRGGVSDTIRWVVQRVVYLCLASCYDRGKLFLEQIEKCRSSETLFLH